MSRVNGAQPKENGYEKVELRNKTKNVVGESRPTSSGLQSFFKLFRTSTNVSVNGGASNNLENNNNNACLKPRLRNSESPGNSSSSNSNSSPTLELGSSTELSSNSSTSCDSLFSIATTGFSFVPVDIYQPDGNTLKVSFHLKLKKIF